MDTQNDYSELIYRIDAVKVIIAAVYDPTVTAESLHIPNILS